jgi:hypothetical protein
VRGGSETPNRRNLLMNPYKKFIYLWFKMAGLMLAILSVMAATAGLFYWLISTANVLGTIIVLFLLVATAFTAIEYQFQNRNERKKF